MTASLSAPYALPGETHLSQPAHQKGLPPAPPHATAQAERAVVEDVKPVVPPKALKPLVKPVQVAKTPVAVPVSITPVPALPSEPVIINKLPDVPAMGN
jgi:hypothetical protein